MEISEKIKGASMSSDFIKKSGIIIFGVVLFSFATLFAQDIKNSAVSQDYRQKLKEVITEDAPEEEKSLEAEAYYRYMPSRSVDAMSGKVAVTEAAQETSYVVKAFSKLPIELSVQDSYLGIENSTPIELPAKLTGVSFGIEATVPFFKFDKTYFRFGVFPSFYTDDWNFNSSAFRMPNRYMLIHQPNDKWTFVAGVAVFPDYVTDQVAPILGFIYKPNDRLLFNIVPTTPSVSYKLNDKLTVFCEGGSSSGEYEVTQDQFKNVILEYKEFHMGSGLQYRINKYAQSSVTVGGIFNRQLRYHPDSLGKVNVGNGFYSEFRLEMKM
jgi:hypothetical protein